nr:linear amide C-N hydrolase [Candidatus Cloacimonadota bacterium]
MLREKGNVRGQIQIYVLLLMSISWCIVSAHSDDRINEFENAISRVDTMSTLNSFSGVGKFYKIDYQGDYEYILQYMNLIFTGGAAATFSEFNCSLFSATGDDEKLFYGRNFDNPECDVLLGRYQSPGKHSSLAFTRLSDLGYPLGTDYFNLSFQQKKKMLNAPYLATDGINECGVAAGLAYVPSVTFTPDPDKQSIFITFLLRKILDEADNCGEALTIANSYNVFDGGNELNIISHHILVSDSLGNSGILEFAEGQWQHITTNDNWQVLTNSPIYNVPVNTLLNQCWRYNLLYNSLLVENGALTDWRQAMDILELASWDEGSSGTEWSTISDLYHNYLYVSIDHNFENIVRTDLENFEFKNYGDINVASYDIQDENGNGTLEQGEGIVMVLNLTADFDTPGLTVTLSSDQSGVNVINPVQVYGDLEAQYELSNYENPFVIELTGSQIPTLLSWTLDFRLTMDIQEVKHL